MSQSTDPVSELIRLVTQVRTTLENRVATEDEQARPVFATVAVVRSRMLALRAQVIEWVGNAVPLRDVQEVLKLVDTFAGLANVVATKISRRTHHDVLDAHLHPEQQPQAVLELGQTVVRRLHDIRIAALAGPRSDGEPNHTGRTADLSLMPLAPLPDWATARKLAEIIGFPDDAKKVDRFLRWFKDKNPTCRRDNRKVDPGSEVIHDPRVEYRVGDVLKPLQDRAERWRTNDERASRPALLLGISRQKRCRRGERMAILRHFSAPK